MKTLFAVMLFPLALCACAGNARYDENRACAARGGVEVVILSSPGQMCVKLEELK